MQIILGFLRAGFLVNFLSHPVLSGFTNAAAIIIAISQFKHVLGFNIPRQPTIFHTLEFAAHHINQTNAVAMGIGLGSIAILMYFKLALGNQLDKTALPQQWIFPITKSGVLLVVFLGIMLVWGFLIA